MADPIDGGPGNDLLYGTTDNDVIRGFGGNDTLYALDDIDQLFGGIGDDALYGGDGVDSLFGGAGNDRLKGVGSFVLLSTAAPSDVLDGGDGIDVMEVSYAGFVGPGGTPVSIVVDIRTGAGEVQVSGFRGENFSRIERLDFIGADGDDRAVGGTYADILDGRGGNDTLRAGSGHDVVRDTWGRIDADGGKGNDRFELRLDYFGHNNLGGTVIDGDAGTMTVGGLDNGQFRNFESLTVQLGHGDDRVVGMSAGVNVVAGGYFTQGSKVIFGGSLNDNLNGGQDNDSIYGGDGNDSMTGWGGANRLFGGLGDDTITVVAGADTIMAGLGNDTVNGGGLGCRIDLGAGNDLMFLYEQAEVSAETYLGGTGTDIFRIYYQNATLDFSGCTLAGFEVLDFVDYGKALNLTMTLTTAQLAQFQRLTYGSIGGDNDRLVIALADNANVVMPEVTSLTGLELADGGQRIDLRPIDSAHVPWVMGGSGDDTVVGPSTPGFEAWLGEGNDSLVGWGAADTVDGGAGNDWLKGGGKGDVLTGDLGRDSLLGGVGNDRLDGGAGADRLTGGAGRDVLIYGEARDSTGLAHDAVVGFDFASADRFDLGGAVTGIAAGAGGQLRSASFNADLELAVDAGRLQAGQALLFTATSGDRSGQKFLVADLNGEDGYQAGDDLLVRLLEPVSVAAFDLADFI